MKKTVLSLLAGVCVGLGSFGYALAEEAPKALTPEQEARKRIADESVAKMKEWKEPITQQSLEQLVNDACALFAQKGPACLSEFKGKDSQFLRGTYLFVVDQEGILLSHPFAAEGKSMKMLRCLKTGIPFIEPLIQIALQNPEKGGWYAYAWKNALHNNAVEDKWTFTKLATYKDPKTNAEQKVIVCAGEFGLQIKK